MLNRQVLLLFITAFTSSPLLADDNTHWYLGTTIGEGEAEVVGHDRDQKILKQLLNDDYVVSGATGSEKDDSNSWKIYGGYQFNRYWAVELSYQDLGETTGLFSATSAEPSVATGEIRSSYQALAIAALGQLPLGHNFTLFSKAGIHYWKHEFDLTANGIESNDTDTDNGLLYGTGVEFKPWQSISFRLEWERFSGIEDEDGIDVKSLGVALSF